MIILTIIIVLFCIIAVLVPVYYEQKETKSYITDDTSSSSTSTSYSDEKETKYIMPAASTENNNVNFDNSNFTINDYKSKPVDVKIITISYGTYNDNSPQKKFSRISNVDKDLQQNRGGFDPIAQIDNISEINKINLTDQMEIIKETISIKSTLVDYNPNKEWKNIYTPSGYKLNKTSIRYNYYSKDSKKESSELKKLDKNDNDDISSKLEQILCCISFNFQILSSMSGDGLEAVNGKNTCISFEKIDGNEIIDFRNSYGDGDGDDNDSYGVEYLFKPCNTHSNKQKFIVSRYSYKYDPKTHQESFIPDTKGLYVSIKHRSLYAGNYYLIWDNLKETGKEFVLKKFNSTQIKNYEHILWLFYPEVNITKPSIPSKSWCNYNRWLKGSDISDLLNDMNDLTSTTNVIPKTTTPTDDPSYENQGVAAEGVRKVTKAVGNALSTAGNVVANGYIKEYQMAKTLVDALDFLDGDDNVYTNLQIKVKKGDVIIPEEYKNDTSLLSEINLLKNADIAKQYKYDPNTNRFEDESVNHLFNNTFINNTYKQQNYLALQSINNNVTTITGFDGCLQNSLFYPEHAYTATNSGKVGDIGFTATVVGNKFDKNDFLNIIDKSISTKDNMFIRDGSVIWKRTDPYIDTITFSNDYFYGVCVARSINTMIGLSFEKLITSPFYEEMNQTNIIDYIKSENGVGTLKVKADELNKNSLSHGKYTFEGDKYIKSHKENGGKNVKINISMGTDYIEDYGITYPGTSYTIGEGISLYINGDPTITDLKKIINFTVGTSYGMCINPTFETIEIGDGSELELEFDGVSLFKNDAIKFLQSNPDMGTGASWYDNLGLKILNGGYGFIKESKEGEKDVKDYSSVKDYSRILIKATNPADEKITAGLLFKVINTGYNTQPNDHMNEDDDKVYKNLYSGVSLFTSVGTRIPTYRYQDTLQKILHTYSIKKYDIQGLKNQFVFDLRDNNEELINDPMVSPSQIGYGGTSFIMSKKKYNTHRDVKILRDLFTNFDQGNSKKTLSTILALKDEKEITIPYDPNQFMKPKIGPATTIKTNTKINFLRTLQFQKLNYGNNKISDIEVGDKLILSNWIPYKKMKIYYNNGLKKHNPGPGINAYNKSELPINFYNFNSAQIIPYGIDHIYDRILSVDSIPTF